MTEYLDYKLLDPKTVKARAALYFLDGGHFLFNWVAGENTESKFVTIDDVAGSFSNQPKDSGWLAPGILRAGRGSRGDWFVYGAPAQKHTLTLTTGDAGEITIPLPPTVLIGMGNAYYLFATDSNDVGPSSRMFHAPFPNVYSHGRICWGSNNRPKAQTDRAEQVWKLFFDSPFNSHLSGGRSQAFQGDVNGQLRQVAQKRSKVYPTSDLVSLRTNLDDLVRRILDRNWRDD